MAAGGSCGRKASHEGENDSPVHSRARFGKSLAFYKRAFGLDVVREITRAEGSRKIVYIGNDTTDFELELVWESGRTEAYDNGSNDTHLAFAVDDVDAARLLHDEMDCVCHELGRDGIYFIEDPDGCCLEIVPSDLWD